MSPKVTVLLCGFACAAQAAAAVRPSEEPVYQARQRMDVERSIAVGPALPSRLDEIVTLPQVALLGVPPPPVAAVEPPPRDVWERIRRNFAMPVLSGPLVDRHQAFYLKRQDILKGIIQRSRRYLYHVVTELERRNLPMELALLPMVESGYHPQALSSAQASGLWQFVPRTGKRYELPQTNTYDARRDVLASTRAALDYLEFLYGMMGDWHLALASYNWGEEQVMAARERNRAKRLPEDYESLTLPEETRFYVPKLQALKNIIADPEAFGITLDPLPNEPYFAIVENTRNLDFKMAAKLAETSLEEFLLLNPGHSGSVVSATDTGVVLVPVEKAEVFSRNLQNSKIPPVRKPRAVVPRQDVSTTSPASDSQP